MDGAGETAAGYYCRIGLQMRAPFVTLNTGLKNRMRGKNMKNKLVKTLLIAGAAVLLTACDSHPTEDFGEIVHEVSETVSEAETVVSEESSESQTEESVEETTEEIAEEIVTTEGYFVSNDFFSVSFIGMETLEAQYETEKEDPNIKMIFKITNRTEHTICKNVGEETYAPGEFWERTMIDRKSRWEKGSGKNNWVHFNLYDESEEQIFAGGFRFVYDEDLHITELEPFDDEELKKQREAE